MALACSHALLACTASHTCINCCRQSSKCKSGDTTIYLPDVTLHHADTMQLEFGLLALHSCLSACLGNVTTCLKPGQGTHWRKLAAGTVQPAPGSRMCNAGCLNADRPRMYLYLRDMVSHEHDLIQQLVSS